jgi:3-deoxy-D-manno-octulosonic-acid transferase
LRVIYSWLIRAAAPFAFAQVLWRGLRDRGYWQGLRERFGFGRALSVPGSIWLHAVSLGEMSAAAPLARALMARYPQLALVVTTATPAGRARAQALFADGTHVHFPPDIRYLPYDTPGSVRRFLARIRPRLAVVMETELWPNLLRECAHLKVPVLLASARLSAKSVARYRRFGGLFSAVFTPNVTVAAQTADDAGRFRAIGAAADRTHVVGNVKFDLAVDDGLLEAGGRLRMQFGAGPSVWVAGSTHSGEEERVLDAHAMLLAHRPDSLLLLAPRHKDRFAAVADLLAQRGIKFTRRSAMAGGAGGAPASGAAVPPGTVLLVDTIGELAALYAAADIAFVGGSLVPIGGHNLLEPAALGVPVLTGPSHFNGKDIALKLLDQGAALQVADADALAAALLRLFSQPDERRRMGDIGKGIVAANRGSVARLLVLIESLLSGPSAEAPANRSIGR